MTWTLVRHHPAVSAAGAKWMVVVLLSTTFWLGILANRMEAGQGAMAWPWLAQAWLMPAVYLMFGPHVARSREFALTLPVPASRIWSANAIVVFLTSGLLVAASLVAITLSLRGISAASDGRLPELAAVTAMLPRLWVQVGAWWLLLAAVVLVDEPGLARLPRTRGRALRQSATVIASVAGIVVLGNLGPVTAVVPLILAAVVLTLAWRRRPRAYSLAPLRPAEPARATGSALPTDRPRGWRRVPIWLVIMLSTGKHPALQLILPPFLLGLGFVLTGPFDAYDRDGSLGILMIPITAYSIFAVAGAPVRRLGLFDNLPLSRGRILAYLLVPQLTLIVGGYVAGELMAAMTPTHGEPIVFGTEAENYGVRLWQSYFAVAWDEAPSQTAPDGESAVPPTCCRVFGSTGPVIYKPYYTPVGASIDFCAWQLERASAQVFGQAIPAAEFKERYLTTTADGVVGLREGGMALMEDHPELRPRRFPGIPALQALAVGLLFLATFGWYLTAFRPGRSDRWQKAGFVVGLSALMALHMLPFLLAIAGRLKPDYLTIAVSALSDRLVAAVPGGAWGLWILVLIPLAGAYRWVLERFRLAEWPPVREDDAAC